MNIVVTSPKTQDLTHKSRNPYDSFWSLKKRPKNLIIGEIVWVVKNGRIVCGFYIRKIVYAKHPIKYAEGHNPSESWHIWFGGLVPDEFLEKHGILDSQGNPCIFVKGFQGFRYQWWKK